MRLTFNVSTVLVCGALAGLTALAQSPQSHAASSSPIAAPLMDLAPADKEWLVRHSSGVEAHFAAANTTHDGHLTRAQAEQGDWSRVAKHFDEIDSDHKGWISVDQIHAFNKSHHKHRKDAAA